MIRRPCAYLRASRRVVPPARGKHPHPPGARRSSSASRRRSGRPCRRGRSRRSRRSCARRRRSRPSSSITSSANASPAEGPPTPFASIETLARQLDVGRLVEEDADDRPRASRGPAATVLTATDLPLAAAQHREAHRGADAPSAASRRETSCGRAHRRAVDRDDHVGRVRASRPPAARAGRPRRARRSGSRAPSARARAARPRPRSCCERCISARSTCRCCAVVEARRDDLLRLVEVGALVQAAEQPLEQRRLAHDHVDEVDAAAVARIVAAGDADERRDGMRAVGQEDVLASTGSARARRRRRGGRARPRAAARG